MTKITYKNLVRLTGKTVVIAVRCHNPDMEVTRMKRRKLVTILAASALFTLGLAATSFAAKGDREIDFSVGLATSPESGADNGFALSVGGGYELLEIKAIKGSTLQVRGDLGYSRWEGSESGKFTRVPLSAGARLYVPIEAVRKLRVYGEASLELSFDKSDVTVNSPIFVTPGVSHSDTNVGLVPGVGVEYVVAPNIFVVGGLRHHIIDHSYLTVTGGVGFKF